MASLHFALNPPAMYAQKLETKLQQESSPSEISDVVAQHQALEKNQKHMANPRNDDDELLLSEKKEETDCDAGQVMSAKKKKKKKRSKKKKSDLRGCDENESGGENQLSEGDGVDLNPSTGSILCPLTSTSSATQRKVKQQYDQLIKCKSVKALTLAQVEEFANCLTEAINELKHKSDVLSRKWTIAQALIFKRKAERSSFERLLRQIFKLEQENKKVEEDALVYIWLEKQLKLLPAYKKVLEKSASKELKDKSSRELDSLDDEFSDMSFEELLELEKKDSFWQKNGRL